MGVWVLTISRDTELARALSRLLIRDGGRGQLWAVASMELARRDLCGHECLPSAIVIDDLFLRGAPLADVAEEFAWYAPLILVARPERQAQVASLVAEGRADFVPRGDYFIPLATALVERTLRREREIEEPFRLPEPSTAAAAGGGEQHLDEESFSGESLRMIGAILDNLEIALGDRSRLSLAVARRLGRVVDLAFDLKQSLSLFAGVADRRSARETLEADRP